MKVIQEENQLKYVAEEDFLFSNAQILQEKLLNGIQDVQSGTVILDLTQITTMDSVGLKLVLGLFKSCRAKGLSLRLEVDSPGIVKLLHLCKLNQLMDIQEGASHV